MREYVFGETQRNKQKKIHFSEDQNKIKTKSKYIYWANITLLLRWMNWNKNNKHFAHNDNNAQHVNYEWFLIKKENYCVVYICVCLCVYIYSRSSVVRSISKAQYSFNSSFGSRKRKHNYLLTKSKKKKKTLQTFYSFRKQRKFIPFGFCYEHNKHRVFIYH